MRQGGCDRQWAQHSFPRPPGRRSGVDQEGQTRIERQHDPFSNNIRESTDTSIWVRYRHRRPMRTTTAP